MSKKVAKSNSNKWPNAIFAILLMCLWVFVSTVAAQFVVGSILVVLLGANTADRPIWTAVFYIVSYIIAGILILLVPINVLTKRKAKSKKGSEAQNEKLLVTREEMGLTDWPTWTDIGLSPIGFIVSMILAAGVLALFSSFPWFDAEQAQEVGFNLYMSSFDRVVAYLTLAVIAPIAEEVIFRGWLYGQIREKLAWLPEWANVAISIIVVSAMFGLIHEQWNVGIIVFSLSAVLCIMREITGTIYAGILTHIIWNTVAFYQIYVLFS